MKRVPFQQAPDQHTGEPANVASSRFVVVFLCGVALVFFVVSFVCIVCFLGE